MNAAADHRRQALLVEAMRQPEFYPHDTEPEIRLVQTHLSYVLLTGPYAYKISKCVQFNFVDYSTLEKRRHFCEEELRLNRLYAPDLYIDVVPLFECEDGFSMTAPHADHAIEFAVQMRQFRAADLLLHVFERGELPEADVESIARRLARFHGEAKTDAAISKYGSPEAVAAMVQENYASLAPFAGRLWDEPELDALRLYTNRVLRDCSELLQRRVDDGRIRECHGDLHLENICYYDGRIEFFDRIVFNDAFKNIDVMYDLAFLYMDLEYRGRPDLANRLLNTYLEVTNDFEGAKLLRFYACCRAQIRSKVLALESAEDEIPATDRPALEREAKAYFALALQYAAPITIGSVTLMCGVSGSGKSSIARVLAARIGAVHIRSDAVRKHLAKASPPQPTSNIYTPEMTQRTYAYLVEGGARLACSGFPVVLDATFGQRTNRQQAVSVLRARGVAVQIVRCVADAETLRQRVENRTGDISDADASVLERQLNVFEALDDAERLLAIELDTTQPIDYDALTTSEAQRSI